MNKIVLLNAPPLAGKDTVADKFVLRRDDVRQRRFKDALMRITACIYSLEPSELESINNDRSIKEKPIEAFNGRSCRQALIHVSEVVIKPNFGKGYFGKISADSIPQDGNELYMFSDSGFSEEVVPIVKKFGADNVAIIKLFREGCNFDGDSRNYLPETLCTFNHRIINNGTIDELYAKVENYLYKIGFLNDEME